MQFSTFFFIKFNRGSRFRGENRDIFHDSCACAIPHILDVFLGQLQVKIFSIPCFPGNFLKIHGLHPPSRQEILDLSLLHKSEANVQWRIQDFMKECTKMREIWPRWGSANDVCMSLFTPSVSISRRGDRSQRISYILIVLFRQSDACNDAWKWIPDTFQALRVASTLTQTLPQTFGVKRA